MMSLTWMAPAAAPCQSTGSTSARQQQQAAASQHLAALPGRSRKWRGWLRLQGLHTRSSRQQSSSR